MRFLHLFLLNSNSQWILNKQIKSIGTTQTLRIQKKDIKISTQSLYVLIMKSGKTAKSLLK